MGVPMQNASTIALPLEVRSRMADDTVELLESIQASHLSRSPTAGAEGSIAAIIPFCREKFLCLLTCFRALATVVYV